MLELETAQERRQLCGYAAQKVCRQVVYQGVARWQLEQQKVQPPSQGMSSAEEVCREPCQ